MWSSADLRLGEFLSTCELSGRYKSPVLLPEAREAFQSELSICCLERPPLKHTPNRFILLVQSQENPLNAPIPKMIGDLGGNPVL